ncbi:hypothetical protein AXG93_3893s1000 [Marchantia polymorpha subsp. ruderalis]|uniref:Uncharacterized protein n=1 Tax=Marchantia polymorpha subsp. ruderalis TaxID=1480154 RepID=A0A176WAF4_MARPO|nr:hypothetical protein AXG93_3893s1000 [Marchantia polymorpha subsp. ruderalis]
MDFLLWGWNWTSEVIVQVWDNNGLPKPPGYQENPKTWQIWGWKKVLRRCAGDDGDLTFDSESVRITREEESAYATLFKHPRMGKNGYRTIWYHDLLRRNVVMALMQILRPTRTTNMMTWQIVEIFHCERWHKKEKRCENRDDYSQGKGSTGGEGALDFRVSSDIQEALAALEDVVAKTVEDVGVAKCESQKVAAATAVVVKERKSQSTEVGFQLTSTAEKKKQEYETEMAARAKKLAEYEAARILDLKLIEKLEARCSELRSQL